MQQSLFPHRLKPLPLVLLQHLPLLDPPRIVLLTLEQEPSARILQRRKVVLYERANHVLQWDGRVVTLEMGGRAGGGGIGEGGGGRRDDLKRSFGILVERA